MDARHVFTIPWMDTNYVVNQKHTATLIYTQRIQSKYNAGRFREQVEFPTTSQHRRCVAIAWGPSTQEGINPAYNRKWSHACKTNHLIPGRLDKFLYWWYVSYVSVRYHLCFHPQKKLIPINKTTSQSWSHCRSRKKCKTARLVKETGLRDSHRDLVLKSEHLMGRLLGCPRKLVNG